MAMKGLTQGAAEQGANGVAHLGVRARRIVEGVRWAGLGTVAALAACRAGPWVGRERRRGGARGRRFRAMRVGGPGADACAAPNVVRRVRHIDREDSDGAGQAVSILKRPVPIGIVGAVSSTSGLALVP